MRIDKKRSQIKKKWPDIPNKGQLFDDELRIWNICTGKETLPFEISKRIRQVLLERDKRINEKLE